MLSDSVFALAKDVSNLVAQDIAVWRHGEQRIEQNPITHHAGLTYSQNAMMRRNYCSLLSQGQVCAAGGYNPSLLRRDTRLPAIPLICPLTSELSRWTFSEIMTKEQSSTREVSNITPQRISRNEISSSTHCKTPLTECCRPSTESTHLLNHAPSGSARSSYAETENPPVQRSSLSSVGRKVRSVEILQKRKPESNSTDPLYTYLNSVSIKSEEVDLLQNWAVSVLGAYAAYRYELNSGEVLDLDSSRARGKKTQIFKFEAGFLLSPLLSDGVIFADLLRRLSHDIHAVEKVPSAYTRRGSVHVVQATKKYQVSKLINYIENALPSAVRRTMTESIANCVCDNEEKKRSVPLQFLIGPLVEGDGRAGFVILKAFFSAYSKKKSTTE